MPNPVTETDVAAWLRGSSVCGCSSGELLTAASCEKIRAGVRADVYRCRISCGGGEERGVVVKHSLDEGCRIREHAALEFLNGRHSPGYRIPAFVCGDTASGYLVMEDLGRGETLEAFLSAGDSVRARKVLLDFAAALGSMHADAARRKDGFDAILARVGGLSEELRASQASDFKGGIPRFARILTGENGANRREVEDDLYGLAEHIAVPRPYLTLTHGDVAPSNVYVLGGDRVALIDFEWSGYRHALYDALFWHIICPLPSDIPLVLDDQYRRAIGGWCPELLDRVSYEREMAIMAQFHVLSFIGWWFPALLRQDDVAAPGVKRREFLLFKMSRCIELMEKADIDGSVLSGLRTLYDKLRRSWGELRIEPWNCFK